MTALIENAVTLADVARQTGTTATAIEAEALAVRMFVGYDWANRPAVEVTDAHKLVSGAARREHDHDVAWHDHQVATEAWEAERNRVWQEAAGAARDEAKSRRLGDGAAAAAGREAATDAVRKFEAKHPAPAFNGLTSESKWFTSTVNRIKEAVR